MPEHERRRIPAWAEAERQGDLDWIGENLHVFWPTAQLGFETSGRGAIVADIATRVRTEQGERNLFLYLPLAGVEESHWEDALRMVKAYDPSWEFVTVLLKGNRQSAYRLGVPTQSPLKPPGR